MWKLCQVFLGCHSTSQNVYLFKVLWSRIWLWFFVHCRDKVLQCYCPTDQQMINLLALKFIRKTNSMKMKYDNFLTLFLASTVQIRKKSVFATNYCEKVFIKQNWILLFFWPKYRFTRNSICWMQTISLRHQLNVTFAVDFLVCNLDTPEHFGYFHLHIY